MPTQAFIKTIMTSPIFTQKVACDVPSTISKSEPCQEIISIRVGDSGKRLLLLPFRLSPFLFAYALRQYVEQLLGKAHFQYIFDIFDRLGVFDISFA